MPEAICTERPASASESTRPSAPPTSASPGAMGVLHALTALHEPQAGAGAAVRALQAAAKAWGADAAVFSTRLQDDATLLTHRQILACDPRWASRYAHACWSLHDPWLRHAERSPEPADGSNLCGDSTQAQAMVSSAAEHGFASVWVVPAPMGTEPACTHVLCLGTGRPQHFGADLPPCQGPLARLLAIELAQWMRKQLTSDLRHRARLSEEDILLLRLDDEGHCSKSIAKRLGCSAHAIDNRFHRLAQRMGTSGRKAAVRMARLYGLI